MLYLLDANVLITANDTYYPVKDVPEFWEWLLHNGRINRLKIPLEIMEEIKAGGGKDTKEPDRLLEWIEQADNEQILLLDEEVSLRLVQRVLNDGYGNLTDVQVDELGRDPFLIAYAMAKPDRCVVTIEKSKPKRQPHKRKIPDVCDTLKVTWCDQFAFNRALHFRTDRGKW